MAKRLNNQSAVIVEPNIFAATNPGYGVRGSSPAAVPALDPSSYTFTAEQLGLDTEPAKQAPVENAGFKGTRIDNGTQPVKGGKLGDFFRGLSGKVRDWRGSDASKGDGGTIGYLGSLYTSPAEEAEYRRRSQNKMKLMALADAVRQFGNIYHTTRSAPSQQFDNIYDKERARYLQDKAVRDRDNQYYLHQKAREAQMDMQRERMEAEAAARAERLAMERPIKEQQAKYWENQARIKGYDADNRPKEIEDKNTKSQKEIEKVVAQTNKTNSDAANNNRRTNAAVANIYDQMAKRKDNRGGGGYSDGGTWTSHRDGSSWRGQPQKNDVKIQEYKNKDQWVISEKDWKYNYARINEILAENPNSAAAKALKNAKNETERMAIAQKYATSTRKSYDYMRALSKGHIPGNKKYATNNASGGTAVKKTGQVKGNSGNGGGTWKNFSIHKSK